MSIIDFHALVFTCLYDPHQRVVAAASARVVCCYSECQGRFTLLSGWGWIRKGCDFLVNFTMNKTLVNLLEISFDLFN